MGTLLGPIGLVVAVPIVALILVLVRHLVHGELYGEGPTFQPAVLRGQPRAPAAHPHLRAMTAASRASLPDHRRRRVRPHDVEDRQLLHPLLPRAHRGVLDRAQAGKTVQDVLGFGGAIPVVGDFAQGLSLGRGATAVLVGIAPAGRPAAGRVARLAQARRSSGRLEVWSGLHTFIGG